MYVLQIHKQNSLQSENWLTKTEREKEEGEYEKSTYNILPGGGGGKN